MARKCILDKLFGCQLKGVGYHCPKTAIKILSLGTKMIHLCNFFVMSRIDGQVAMDGCNEKIYVQGMWMLFWSVFLIGPLDLIGMWFGKEQRANTINTNVKKRLNYTFKYFKLLYT